MPNQIEAAPLNLLHLPASAVSILISGDGKDRQTTIESIQQARCDASARIIPSTDSPDELLKTVDGNSDVVFVRAGTRVSAGWLDRLLWAARNNPQTATVTAFSNEPGIVGYPTVQGGLPPANLNAVNRFLQEVNSGRAVPIPAPTGSVVFTRRDYLSDLLTQDPAVRWRWRHLLAADVFVETNLDRPGEVLPPWTRRSCDAELDRISLECFAKSDSLRLFRRLIDASNLIDTNPAFLLISLIGGGGTERHTRDLSQALEAENIRAIIMRPDAQGNMVLERYATPDTPNLVFNLTQEYYLLLRVLRQLRIAHLHIHHLLGHGDKLIQLVKDLRTPYDLTLHDYYTVCPRAHLMDRNARYCGQPGPEECNRCIARNGDYYGRQEGIEINSWRRRARRWLNGARKVFVPHGDVAKRMGQYFPDINFTVRGHFEHLTHSRRVACRPTEDAPLRVAVLGTILPHKGSEVLLECARDSLERQLPIEFHVVGMVHRPEEFQKAGVAVTGPYLEHQVFDLLEQARCHCALFLTILPETYCYTLSIALSGGLYSVGFDLGAQGERIKASGWGHVLPLDTPPNQINDDLLRLKDKLATLGEPPLPKFASYGSILHDYYELDLNNE